MSGPEAEPLPRKAARPPRRRRRIYVTGWNVRVVVHIAGLLVVLWGLCLGDVWLWRLLYG